jgi:hypothetical protein
VSPARRTYQCVTFFAAQHARELHKIARLAAGAGADIGAVEFDVAEFLRLFALAGIRMARHRRFELVEVHNEFVNELLPFCPASTGS